MALLRYSSIKTKTATGQIFEHGLCFGLNALVYLQDYVSGAPTTFSKLFYLGVDGSSSELILPNNNKIVCRVRRTDPLIGEEQVYANIDFYKADGTLTGFGWGNFRVHKEALGMGIAYDEDARVYRLYLCTYADDASDYLRTDATYSITLREVNFFADGVSEDAPDPFKPGGDSDDDPDSGDFDNPDDDINIPDLPDISVVNTGFVNLYHPNIADLNILSSYMWSGLFDVDSFRKLFADPMDCILGLSIVPVPITDGALEEVSVGNIGTGVYIKKVANQYVQVDCGTITLSPYWKAYLDYAPYTKIHLYLPYIGAVQLSTDDVMNKSINIRYNVDVLSGSCVAFVKCGNSVLYSYSGQCSISIPVNANNYTQMITSIASGVAKVGLGIATGGAATVAGVASAAINVATSKPTIERSGTVGSMCGLLGIQKPYLIIEKPRQCHPARQNAFTGYPSYTTVKLSDVAGYTEVMDIKLKGVSATQNEIDEIVSLLKEGVIF